MTADNNDLASSFEQLLLNIDISSMPLIYIQQKIVQRKENVGEGLVHVNYYDISNMWSHCSSITWFC